MSNLSLIALAACVGVILGSEALARSNTTTESCLARKLCAYVDPKGRVTCGPCPGQARTVRASLGVAGRSKSTLKTCAAKWDAMAPSQKSKTTRADHAAACFYKASALPKKAGHSAGSHAR